MRSNTIIEDDNENRIEYYRRDTAGCRVLKAAIATGASTMGERPCNAMRCFTEDLTYINKACKIVTPRLSTPERFNTSCVESLRTPLSMKCEN